MITLENNLEISYKIKHIYIYTPLSQDAGFLVLSGERIQGQTQKCLSFGLLENKSLMKSKSTRRVEHGQTQE